MCMDLQLEMVVARIDQSVSIATIVNTVYTICLLLYSTNNNVDDINIIELTKRV